MSPASRLACLLFAGLAATLSCRADSFTSSASSAGSASIGSLSDSVTGSSGSISHVAEGDYRILEVAQAERPETLRLKLRHVARKGEVIQLLVPRAALGEREAAPGGVVGVRQRPYGYEFAWADTRVAFFLALAPEWRRELDSKPL